MPEPEGQRRDLIESLSRLRREAAGRGRPGDLRPLAAVEAVAALLGLPPVPSDPASFPAAAGATPSPAIGTEERWLTALGSALARFEPAVVHPEWLERAPLATGSPVWTGSLDRVLGAQGMEAAGGVVARMLSVMLSPEAFHELILEAAARSPDPSLLVTVGAAVRCLDGRRWEEDRIVLYRILEALRSAEIPSRNSPAGEAGELPWIALWTSAPNLGDRLWDAAPYLRQAWESDRLCRTRGRALRSSVGSRLRSNWPELDPRRQTGGAPVSGHLPVPREGCDPKRTARLRAGLLDHANDRLARGETEAAVFVAAVVEGAVRVPSVAAGLFEAASALLDLRGEVES